ncbi:hypothetical protein NL676_019794 [Syzygium grande]|nr:hypothetical protein NL676_019794 [Syzygium grande]
MHMGISRCFPWLLRHGRRGEKLVDTSAGQKPDNTADGEMRDGFETLPDDVVVDVLIRLEDVGLGRAKIVCRRWRALIGTAHFTRVRLQRSSPVTLMGSMSCLLYGVWGSRDKKPTRGVKLLDWRRMRGTMYRFFDLLGCCDGLLIFICPITKSRFEIYNPVTREGITLQQEGSICGFFLHSLSNKYRLLSYRETPDGFSYHVGGLALAAWKDVGMFPYRPREQEAPSGVKGCLHWMVVGKHRMSPPCSHSIMVFSTGESELRFMPHPGDSCPSNDGHSNMHLVEIKGRVYVYAIHVKLACVWVLEDSASWHWVKMCDIDLEWGLNGNPGFVTSYSNYKNMQLVDSHGDGELLLFWPRRGFFLYNLRSETITKFSWNFSIYRAMSRMVVAEFKRSLVSVKHLRRR